jgi:uncharacterized protein
MQCPLCAVELQMTERQGVEIDYCPKCRGVWLDRGELDKLIERAAQVEARSDYSRPSYGTSNAHDFRDVEYGEERKNDERYPDDNRYAPPGKKRKSFLDDVFDIFD